MSTERESLFPDRIGQLNDDVILRLVLRPETEEWAEELLLETADSYGVADDVERTAEGLVLTHRVGGNCSAIYNAKAWLDDIDDALREGEIVPMEFVLTVHSEAAS
jgi:hypothetical protein